MTEKFYFVLWESERRPGLIARIELVRMPPPEFLVFQRERFPEATELLERALRGLGCAELADQLDLHFRTPWEERVLKTLRDRVPSGQVVSYGELAALSGSPGAARAVGTIMSHNPFPLYYPCHRVVAAGGKPGGFMGTTGDTPELAFKRRLLAAELAAARLILHDVTNIDAK